MLSVSITERVPNDFYNNFLWDLQETLKKEFNGEEVRFAKAIIWTRKPSVSYDFDEYFWKLPPWDQRELCSALNPWEIHMPDQLDRFKVQRVGVNKFKFTEA